MKKYSVRLKRSAVKEIENIPRKADRRRIMAKIGGLADNPRPIGCQKLAGKNRYRIRQGVYRILYSIEDDILTVYVVKIAHRRNVYRDH